MSVPTRIDGSQAAVDSLEVRVWLPYLPHPRIRKIPGPALFLCFVISTLASSAPAHAAPKPRGVARPVVQACQDTQQLWVSQPLLEKLSVEGIEKAVSDFAAEATGSKKPDSSKPGPSFRETLSKVDVRKEAQWPKMLLADGDTPAEAGFMIPSEFRASNLQIPQLRFGRPEIEAQTDAAGKPLANRYRVRVPVEELDVTMDVGLDSKIPGGKSQALFGIQGLRASLDRSNAAGVPAPVIEYEVELQPGQTLADAIEIQAQSGRFHLPASQLDIGLAIKKGDEKRRQAFEQALNSPELAALSARISQVKNRQELERLLSSDELRGLESRHPGIGEHLAAFVKQECSGLYLKDERQIELSQSMLVREIQMKLALDALKPQVANRSSLEALMLMRMLVIFAGRVETDERNSLASGAKSSVPPIGSEGQTPLYDGMPGVYPVLNEKLGPLLAERLAASLRGSKLAEPFALTVPGKTPADLLNGDPRAKARPFQPRDRTFETRRWSPANPAVGGAVASVAKCGDGGEAPPNSTSWLKPELAARLAKSGSAAVGITVDEVNSYLAEAFSEKSQNEVEYPDKKLRLTFTEPPKLLVEKAQKTGQNALYLDVEMRERRAGIGGFLSGGTSVRSKVRVYQDQKGMLRLDASRTGQRMDDRDVVGVFDTLLQALTGRMFAKGVFMRSKVIPGLNESIQIEPRIGDWRINALEPSTDGKRVVLGVKPVDS